MISTTLLSAQNPGASVVGKNTNINIDSPLDDNGRKLYRQLYYLHFTVDPACEGIVIDTKSSILQGYFHDYTLHLTENNLNFQTFPWQATTESDNDLPDLVKVHLTHPWQLQAVSTVDHRGVEVLRLDGDVVSGEPTIKGNANVPFGSEFTGQDFALRKVTTVRASSHSKKAKDKTQPTSTKASTNNSDNNFALELESNQADIGLDAANNNTVVAAHGIKTIKLKSLPTGPRILLGEMAQTPSLDDNLLSIWQQPGEQTQLPVHFLKDDNTWQAAFKQIQKACDSYFAKLLANGTLPSADLYLPIIFECDTPARLRITEFKLDYGLLRQHLDNIESKHTLKFAGNTIENQQLPLSLPVNSTIKHATLRLNNSLKNGFGLADNSTLANILHQHTGVDMAKGLTVANRVHNTEPQQVDCIVLAVLPFSDDSKATLQIVQDVNNGPKGSVLAQTQIELQQPHVRQWAVAKFPSPTLLDSGVYWLSLTIQQGHLIWLGEFGDGIVHIQQKDKVDKKIDSLKLLTLSGISIPQPGASADVTIQIADTPAPVLKQDNSELTFNLKDGLNLHYGTGRPPPVLVNLTSGSKGNLTIKAVEVVYHIETS